MKNNILKLTLLNLLNLLQKSNIYYKLIVSITIITRKSQEGDNYFKILCSLLRISNLELEEIKNHFSGKENDKKKHSITTLIIKNS